MGGFRAVWGVQVSLAHAPLTLKHQPSLYGRAGEPLAHAPLTFKHQPSLLGACRYAAEEDEGGEEEWTAATAATVRRRRDTTEHHNVVLCDQVTMATVDLYHLCHFESELLNLKGRPARPYSDAL